MKPQDGYGQKSAKYLSMQLQQQGLKIDPTFGLRGALITPVVSHRAAFTDKERFGGLLLRALWNYEGAPETGAGLKLWPCSIQGQGNCAKLNSQSLI